MFAIGHRLAFGRCQAAIDNWQSDHGEFLSTLDELAADQDSCVRHRGRLRVNGCHMVLRHTEVYEGRLSTDPAGAISARYSRHAIGNGLPVLPQLRRRGGSVECAQHPDLHELP